MWESQRKGTFVPVDTDSSVYSCVHVHLCTFVLVFSLAMYLNLVEFCHLQLIYVLRECAHPPGDTRFGSLAQFMVVGVTRAMFNSFETSTLLIGNHTVDLSKLEGETKHLARSSIWPSMISPPCDSGIVECGQLVMCARDARSSIKKSL